MPFLQFLFSPQAQKFRNGYYINHDTLMNVSPQARSKLIFYFIAQQLPQKLAPEDKQAYYSQRTKKIGVYRTLWMTAALLGPLAAAIYLKRPYLTRPHVFGKYLIYGGLLTPLAVAIHTRVYQARFVDNSKVIDDLSQKYNYGIYDFSVAKKEAHILNLLYTMDAPYEKLHS